MTVKQILWRSLGGVAVLASLIYAGDYFSLRFRIPHNRQQLGSIEVQPYYAIAEKNNKTEFISADPQMVTCVHSWFPHFGYQPCWYVARHTDKRIDE